MIKPLQRRLSGDGLAARALRGTGASVLTAFSEHGLRLISNLVLTRLLFPEAFGLMALVQVVLAGVGLATTFGLQASVIQDPRGDDPDFLNTAWTINAIRGGIVWLLICLCAIPAARFYEEPILAQLLPVAGFSMVIQGFQTTKALSLQRHLRLGRIALMNISVQIVNLVCIATLAYLWGSVWALAAGYLISPSLLLILYHKFLPGIRNRFRMERRSAVSIFTLGKYLFISTIATYVLNQSDRAILGTFIPTEMLGVYSIGFTLATLPWMLAQKIAGMVVFPLYRMRHPSESAANRAQIFKARRIVVAGTLCLVAVMAFAGPALVHLLYDERYVLAGPITVLISFAYIPAIVLIGLMNAALARGDSLALMVVNVTTALCQLSILIPSVKAFGIPGAALAIGTAPLLTYPITAYYMRRHGNWDRIGDLMLFGAGYALTGSAIWLYWDGIVQLFG